MGGEYPPAGPVGRFADLGEVVRRVERVGLEQVGGVRPGGHLERGVVAPLVRVADPVHHRVELLVRLGLGRLAHPGEPGEPGAELRLDVAHHLERPGLGLRREELPDVGLTQDLAQRVVGHGETALPSRALLLDALKHDAVEAEALVHERRAEGRRHRVEQAPAKVCSPLLQRGVRHQRVHRPHESGLRDVELRRCRDPPFLEVVRPADRRRLPLQLIAPRQMVHRFGIALLLDRHRGVRQRRLELHDRRGSARRGRAVGPAEPQHAADVRHVLPADGSRSGVGLEVVLPLRQAESRLVQLGDGPAAVFGVGVGPEEEAGVRAVLLEPGQGTRRTRPARDRIDPAELLGEGPDPGGLDRRGIHAAGVEKPEPAGVGVLGGPRLRGGLVEEPVKVGVVAVLELVEGAPPGLVARNRRPLDPAAVGPAVEVLAGRAGGVPVGGIERAGLGRCRTLGRNEAWGQHECGRQDGQQEDVPGHLKVSDNDELLRGRRGMVSDRVSAFLAGRRSPGRARG